MIAKKKSTRQSVQEKKLFFIEKIKTPRRHSWWVGLLGLSLFVGCSDPEIQAFANFNSPSAMAIAGTQTRYLFVANSTQNTVQVVTLGAELEQIEFVRSPTRAFPLQIPVGDSPRAMSVSNDMKYVLVLNTLSESIRLIDADRLLLVRGEDGLAQQFPIGPKGSSPQDILAIPKAAIPNDGSLGHYFVTLPGWGAIAHLVLSQSGQFFNIEINQLIRTGGQPTRLAITPLAELLFATDAEAQEIIRIDVGSGTISRLYVGDYAGPIAVAENGMALLVGRPKFKDILVFSNLAAAQPKLEDANPFFAPIPKCLSSCTSGSENLACENQHPADQSNCTNDDGIAMTTDMPAYPALYLGTVPAQIIGIGQATGSPALDVKCADEHSYYASFAMVAGMDGSIFYVGLPTIYVPDMIPHLINFDCNTPHFNVSTGERTALAEIFETCLSTPTEQNRWQCILATNSLSDEPSEQRPGIVVSPRNTGDAQWNFWWEGYFEKLNRSPGGGVINNDGSFTDLGINFFDYDIRPRQIINDKLVHHGDILEILTEALGECPELKQNCVVERRIWGIERVSEKRSRLVLDRPLRGLNNCYPTGGVIDYRIRVGDQFIMYSPERPELGYERISPGDRFGPGGSIGLDRNMLFRIKPIPVHPTRDACERYDDTGFLAQLDGDPVELAHIKTALSRDEQLMIQIYDGYSLVGNPYNASDSQNEIAGPLGRIPSDILLSPFGANEPLLFITYMGTNNLFAFIPFRISTLYHDGRYANLH